MGAVSIIFKHPLRLAALLLFCAHSHALGRDGGTVYEEVCATCHDAGVARTPPRSALAQLSSKRIVAALETGTMRLIGNFSMTGPERVAVAEFLSGEAYDPRWADSGANRCPPSTWPQGDPFTQPHWNGWGNGLANTRYQSARAAGLRAAEIPKLELAWAFAFPGETFVESQPTVVGGRLFIGSPSGVIYALDAKTGCSHWTFQADGPVKSALTLAKIAPHGDVAVFFGDQTGRVYSLDAASGALRWKKRGDAHPSARVTGGVQVFENKLYVPMASLEEALALDPNYRCCVFRGSVSAYDVDAGELLWKRYTIEHEASVASKDSHGKPMVGPSGASVWSAVTIDPGRRRIYVGTGDNYSQPTTDSSDAVLALDLDTGKRLWVYQGLAGDAWNVGCMAVPKVNCPEREGPDEDMGASPILVTAKNGRELIIATQKSGVAHAIDPHKSGALLWARKLAKGGIQGGLQWGQASDGELLYASISDTDWLSDSSFSAAVELDPDAGGGLVAVDILSGEIRWRAAPIDCSGRPRCSPSQSAAVSAIADIIFSGSLSGEMRAFDARSGKEVWRFDTAREFATVNGARGHGGAIDQAGAVAVDGMLYFNSGYSKFGGNPGNVVLAFRVPQQRRNFAPSD